MSAVTLEKAAPAARVASGAALMDRVRPGWADLIYVEAFDISDYNACIIGQLWSEARDGYSDGLNELANAADLDTTTTAMRFGFDNEGFVGYPELQAAWLVEISERVS